MAFVFAQVRMLVFEERGKNGETGINWTTISSQQRSYVLQARVSSLFNEL